MNILQHLLSLFFPERCVSCNKKDETLCNTCIQGFSPADPFPKEWILPLYYYKDPKVRKALWALKYGNRKLLGNIFGKLLYEHFLEEAAEEKLFADNKRWLVIPIPASLSRKKKRGYNQALLLAKGICEADTEKILMFTPLVLRKSIHTKSQTETKSRTERLGNVYGSFTVINPVTVYGAHILLIDDIVTTGATLIEAKRVLKEAGAKTVTALTVAH